MNGGEESSAGKAFSWLSLSLFECRVGMEVVDLR